MKTRLAVAFAFFFATTLSAQFTPTSTLRKAIVPLVGSTPGAHGALFKTFLRIDAMPGGHGVIVFHPIGRMASNDDPSMKYSFPETSKLGDALEFDDIVAAMGQTGLGSLDIIPDADGGNIVPPVRTRVYNDAPTGTFGADESLIYPVNYFVDLYGYPPARGLVLLHAATYVPAMSARFRRNIGFRTLSEVDFTAYVVRKDGSQQHGLFAHFPGEYSLLLPVEEFARQYLGAAIGQDDGLVIWTQNGQAITYYTYTDNGTNDPSIVITPPVDLNVMLADVPQ
jgi:hypothetical protein